MSVDDDRLVRASSRLDLGTLLAAVEAAPPVAAIDVVATLLADMVGAERVSFLIADYSGDSLIRLGHQERNRNGRRLGRETTERVALHGTPHGEALSGQSVEVMP